MRWLCGHIPFLHAVKSEQQILLTQKRPWLGKVTWVSEKDKANELLILQMKSEGGHWQLQSPWGQTLAPQHLEKLFSSPGDVQGTLMVPQKKRKLLLSIMSTVKLFSFPTQLQVPKNQGFCMGYHSLWIEPSTGGVVGVWYLSLQQLSPCWVTIYTLQGSDTKHSTNLRHWGPSLKEASSSGDKHEIIPVYKTKNHLSQMQTTFFFMWWMLKKLYFVN